MGLFITNVDVAIVNVAAPAIHEQLNASGSELQLVVSGYILSYAMLLITGARLGDIFGYRRLFLSGLGVFTVASLICGLAPNATVLIAARVVQGIGAAMLVPQVLTGIQLNCTGNARTRAIGLYSVALSVGAVAGQVLGGVLVSANLFETGWRPIFLIKRPQYPITHWRLPESLGLSFAQKLPMRVEAALQLNPPLQLQRGERRG